MNKEPKKRCNECRKYKTYNHYWKHPSTKDGLVGKCKECYNSKENKIKMMYKNQRSNAIQRGHELPNYDYEWLKEWLYNQELFHKLYEDYKNSGYKKDLCPSVDRINHLKTYSKDNIQLMTWEQNNYKGHIENVDRINPVIFIKDGIRTEYLNMKECNVLTGISMSILSNVLYNENVFSKGFLLKYKNPSNKNILRRYKNFLRKKKKKEQGYNHSKEAKRNSFKNFNIKLYEYEVYTNGDVLYCTFTGDLKGNLKKHNVPFIVSKTLQTGLGMVTRVKKHKEFLGWYIKRKEISLE